jgi:hypothetical protein
MAWLMQYHDPGLDVPADESAASIKAAERERLARQLAVTIAAKEIPRRLGIEAGAEVLALDKKRARRIEHALAQSLKAWGDATLPAGDEINQQGAQIDWSNWCEQHTAWLKSRIVYIATWAVKAGGDDKFAKNAVVRLQNELSWVTYALRD